MYFLLILNYILYLNISLKLCYIMLSINERIDNFIYKHNHNKCLLIISIISQFYI